MTDESTSSTCSQASDNTFGALETKSPTSDECVLASEIRLRSTPSTATYSVIDMAEARARIEDAAPAIDARWGIKLLADVKQHGEELEILGYIVSGEPVPAIAPAS